MRMLVLYDCELFDITLYENVTLTFGTKSTWKNLSISLAIGSKKTEYITDYSMIILITSLLSL